MDADAGRVTLLGPDDQRLTADTHGTDIILQAAEREGLPPTWRAGCMST